MHPCTMIWFIQTILKAEVNEGCAILKFATALLSDINFVYAFAFLIGQALILKVSSFFTDCRSYRRLQSVQIEVRASFFVWRNFFRTFIKIHNIEIRNRLLWVRWYHGNSTFPPYWNAGGAVANFNIAETLIFLQFQYCLDKTIS